MSMWRNVSAAVLVVVIGALAGGCRKKAVDEAAEDVKVLEELAEYKPTAKQNDQGRVIDLKLEGKHIDDKSLDRLKDLPELKSLSLYGSSVTDEGLSKLKGSTRLEALGLGKTKITRRGLAHLERLPALRWLWVGENAKISTADVDDFKAKAVPGITVYK